jgi:hypothetical protein
MKICNKPRWRISSVRIFSAVFFALIGVLIFAFAFLAHPFVGILLAYVAGWCHRSSQVYYEPAADPISQIDRDNNARN